MDSDMQLQGDSSDEITLSLGDVNDLFNDPDVDPLSHREVDVLGASGLSRILARLLAWRLRSRDIHQITRLLPADEIGPTTEADAAASLRRYSLARIEDNHLVIRTTLIQAMTQLVAVIIVVAVVGLLFLLLLNQGVLSTSTPLGLLVAFSISVLAWVTLWDPVESLAFDWIPAYRESRVLKNIMGMRIVVRPDDAQEKRTRTSADERG